MIEDLLKELQEIEGLQSQIEARIKKLAQSVKSNKASKQERNRYKSLKGQLNSVAQKARSVKTSIAQIKASTITKTNKVLKQLFKQGFTNNVEDFKVAGPFDSLPGDHPYIKAAKAAGNRIELKHPGFFAKYGSMPTILDVIWENYASYHRDNYYEVFGDLYVDDTLYDNLLVVLSYEERRLAGEFN